MSPIPPYYELPRSTPEEQGISSSAILAFLNAAEQRNLEIHSFMLIRHRHVVAEGWWSPIQPSIPQTLYSVTKSFTSTAVGFAVQEGLLSVDDRVLSFFPEEVTKEIEHNMGTMKVKHLLTMSTGHTQDTIRFIKDFRFLNDRIILTIGDRTDGNWVKGFLDIPIQKPPGTYFLYDSGASQMLSEIVTRVTGQTLLDYLQPRLFDPLGIDRPVWDYSPDGTNVGYSGLRLKTEDLARFGLFYLQKGLWNGRRLLSQSWVEEATSKQIDTSQTESDPDRVQGYGYQFWRSRHDSYRAMGFSGQFVFVLPKQDAVISITSGVKNMQEEINLIWEYLLPSMKDETVPYDNKLHHLLLSKLKSLSIVPKPMCETHAQTSIWYYQMEPNGDDVKAVLFDYRYDKCIFTWWDNSGENCVTCGLREWVAEGNMLSGEITAIRGIWSDEKTFIIHLVPISGAYHDKLVCHFEKGRVYLDYYSLADPKGRGFIGNLLYA